MEDTDETRPKENRINSDINDTSKVNNDQLRLNNENNTSASFEDQQNPNNWNRTEYQYKNAREYAQVLQAWLWQYRFFTTMNAFHCQLVSSMPVHNQSQNVFSFDPVDQQSETRQPNTPQNVPEPPRQRLIPPAGRNAGTTGTRYKVPMLWRRLAAECLDFILLFYIKILVTFAVLRQMGYMNENVLDLEDPVPFLTHIENFDYERLLGFTSELIALEVVNRVCITLVETLCLRQGYAGFIGGATPGKKIMQLRVVSYDSITDLRNGHILVMGERDPGFFNALVRSVIKNFSLAFFFPACFTVFFFRFNRAAYDVLAHTIVVEVERPPN